MPTRVGGFPRGKGVCGARQKNVKRQGGARGQAIEDILHHGSGLGQNQVAAMAFPRRSPVELDN